MEGAKKMAREARRRFNLIAMGARGQYTWKQKERDEEVGIALEKEGSEKGKVVLRKGKKPLFIHHP